MLEAIDLIDPYLRDTSFAQFAATLEKQDAVVRRLALIGEAAKGIPDDFRARYPNVPWRDMAGARDILVHQYFRIDLALAWSMAVKDMPSLREKLEAVIVAEGYSSTDLL
jgi:uncharacterized protein with HEPN domain